MAAEVWRCGRSTISGGRIVIVAKNDGVQPFVRPVIGL
jgi:hypothetical protein